MSTTAPAALLPLDAPLPEPRSFTLLDAARLLTPEEDRWLGGAWINEFPVGDVSTFDPCSTGTFRAKRYDATVDRPTAFTFTVYMGQECTAMSVGPTADRFKTKLAAAFLAREAEAVERVLATGDGHAGALGAYLADTNMEALNGGTAVSPTEGLALLEDEIADAGGGGIIHVPPATATYWKGQTLIESRNGVMRTGLGTRVAVGAGYMDVDPDDWPAAGAGEEWAFASGLVGYVRGPDPEAVPNTYAEALDRSQNQVAFLVERDYLLVWVGRQASNDDNHVQAGVLIDRLA